MSSKVLLMLTDDPDDYTDFSSMLEELSSEAILVAIASANKASRLLQETALVPACIVLSLSLYEVNVPEFLQRVNETNRLSETRKVLYGTKEAYEKVKAHSSVDFLDTDLSYTEIQAFLQKVL